METTGICRFCHATCGLKVTIEHGRVTRLIGDVDNPVYHGYSCVKGRNFHQFHYDPARVLHPLRRGAGRRASNRSRHRVALEGVGQALSRILAAHGPRSVAMYSGTFSHFCPAGVMLREAFMDAIGSPMRFTQRHDRPARQADRDGAARQVGRRAAGVRGVRRLHAGRRQHAGLDVGRDPVVQPGASGCTRRASAA